MLCTNGEIKKIGKGIFFICQQGKYQGLYCGYARWCFKDNCFKMTKNDCSNYRQ